MTIDKRFMVPEKEEQLILNKRFRDHRYIYEIGTTNAPSPQTFENIEDVVTWIIDKYEQGANKNIFLNSPQFYNLGDKEKQIARAALYICADRPKPYQPHFEDHMRKIAEWEMNNNPKFKSNELELDVLQVDLTKKWIPETKKTKKYDFESSNSR